jgi:peptidoglycan/xylan/chitin deacetylase (PgdA/CDA1 family)
VRRTLGMALLPTSILPLVLLGLPSVRAEHASLRSRFVDRRPLPAPVLQLAGARAARWSPLPAWRGAVPVLVYHGISAARDGYSVSREAFAEQMAMLRRTGFEALSIAQYVGFLNGEQPALPARPILITFDDGRLDSYRGADRVLARAGMRATMFVITSQPGRRSRFYATWSDLRAMAASGRWDLQVHAGDGHRLVRVDAAGRLGPMYANRAWVGGRLQSLAGFQRAVAEDIAGARDALAAHIPGFRPLAFAAPFGNLGRFGTNDARIPAWTGAWLRRRFGAVFVQQDAGYTTRSDRRDALPRHEVRTGETADTLYAWLRAHRPRMSVPPVAGLAHLHGARPTITHRARRHG